MKIAITGGSGFIGTELCKLLKDQGHEIVILDIQPSKAFPDDRVNADVRDQEAMDKHLAGVDAIYHLAAEHRDDIRPTEKYYDVNVGGAEKIVAAAEKHGIKNIIFTSTVAVYGLKPVNPQTGSTEEDPPSPFNDYGQSKLDSEVVFEKWAAEDPERSLVTLRLVATFGPGNRGNIYTLMNQIARGKFIMIGDGKNSKSVAYLGNVTAFLVHTLNFGPGIHLYNYADKPDLNMNGLIGHIRSAFGMEGTGPRLPYALGLMGGLIFDVAAKITGRNFPISKVRIEKFCANTVVSADKLQNTGFKAPYSLQAGLEEMIAAEFPDQKKAA